MHVHELFIEKQIKNPAVYGETKVWLHLNGASVSIYMYIVDDPAYWPFCEFVFAWYFHLKTDLLNR